MLIVIIIPYIDLQGKGRGISFFWISVQPQENVHWKIDREKWLSTSQFKGILGWVRIFRIFRIKCRYSVDIPTMSCNNKI